MTAYIISLLVLLTMVATAVVGFVGIHKAGNYETVWGGMFFGGVVASILMIVGTAGLSIFS